MATNDPTKPLDVESMGKGALDLENTSRSAPLGAAQTVTNGEKSLHRYVRGVFYPEK